MWVSVEQSGVREEIPTFWSELFLQYNFISLREKVKVKSKGMNQREKEVKKAVMTKGKKQISN